MEYRVVPRQWPASDRGRPSMITHSGLGLIVFRLGAGRSTDGRVGEVHMRRHRVRVRGASRLRIGKVVGRSRRRHAAVRRRSPAQASHVWTATDAVGSVVAVRRGLKRLWRTIRVRSHRRSSMRRAAKARKRWGGGRGRSTGTALRKVAANVRRDWPAAHVVIASRTMHRQWRKITTRRHGRMLRRRWSRVDRSMIGEHSVGSTSSFLVLAQIGLRLGSRLLNGPSMMVLMTGQSCTACERLLAVRVGAFIGSLSGVNTTVAGKR